MQRLNSGPLEMMNQLTANRSLLTIYVLQSLLKIYTARPRENVVHTKDDRESSNDHIRLYT